MTDRRLAPPLSPEEWEPADLSDMPTQALEAGKALSENKMDINGVNIYELAEYGLIVRTLEKRSRDV